MEKFSYSEQAHLWKPEGRSNGVVLRDSADIFHAISSGKEQPSAIVPYMEWKENGFEAEPWNLIVDVPPAILFTNQEKLSEDKMIRARNSQEELTPDAFTVGGIIFTHPKPHMGRVPVLLEGNHRAAHAMTEGLRVNFLVSTREIPADTPVWRLTTLNKYSGLRLVR